MFPVKQSRTPRDLRKNPARHGYPAICCPLDRRQVMRIRTIVLAHMLVRAALLVSVLVATSPRTHAESFTFTRIDVPGASDTSANGINNAGQIVGSASSSGFLYSGGSFTQIGLLTFANGINNAAQIVGSWFSGGPPGDSATHG